MPYNFTAKTDSVDDVMAADINELQAALEALEYLTLDTITEKTISAGELTADQVVHKIQPESSTSDDLDTISGLSAGDLLVLVVSDNGTDTITIKHGTGNISCIGDSDVELSEGAAIFYSDGTTVYLIGGGGGGGDLVDDTSPQLGGDLDLNGHVITSLPNSEGWTAVTDTWAYASATTITVPSGAASIYSVGDKIKLTQTTVKYFYIVGVADTVLTVTGGSDYTVANAAITLPYYSKVATPVGFPHHFNYTPTCTQSGALTFTTGFSYFSIINRNVLFFVNLTFTNAGTAANQIKVSLPVSAATGAHSWSPIGHGNFNDVSGSQYNCQIITEAGLASPATNLVFVPTYNASIAGKILGTDPSFAVASGDGFNATGTYTI